MRVLYFSRDYTPHDHRFLTALAQTEHEVHYLRLEWGQELESRPLPVNVRQVDWWIDRRHVRLIDGPQLLIGLRRVLHELQPDLVHAGPVQQCAFFTAAVGFQPLLTMSWGSDLLVGAAPGVGRWIAKYALARSAVLVCDCRTVSSAAQQLGMPAKKIVAFPWGVDLGYFVPGEDGGLKAKLGWGDDFVLLSTRSWEPICGVVELMEGFIQAAQFNPRLRLMVLGGGSLQTRIEAMLSEAGMLERVHFAGRVGYAELPDYYQAADIYVSASHSDGSSISLLEAMASGLPALVSDIPGNREWVEPGVNGWWFPDGDVESLAERILLSYQALPELKRLGSASRLIAEQRADWKRNFESLLKAYDLALKGRRFQD